MGNDHSKHEQLFAHETHPIICIVVIHWAHQLPTHGISPNWWLIFWFRLKRHSNDGVGFILLKRKNNYGVVLSSFWWNQLYLWMGFLLVFGCNRNWGAPLWLSWPWSFGPLGLLWSEVELTTRPIERASLGRVSRGSAWYQWKDSF